MVICDSFFFVFHPSPLLRGTQWGSVVLCPDGSGTWAGGALLLGAGVGWDADARAIALPPLWPD